MDVRPPGHFIWFKQWKAEVLFAVTHLALARSQFAGTDILGIKKRRRAAFLFCKMPGRKKCRNRLFFIHRNDFKYRGIGWIMSKKYKTILFIIGYIIVISLWIRFCFSRLPLDEQDISPGIHGTDSGFLIDYERDGNNGESAQESDSNNKTDKKENSSLENTEDYNWEDSKDKNADESYPMDDSENTNKISKLESKEIDSLYGDFDSTKHDDMIRILIKADNGSIFHDHIILKYDNEELPIEKNASFFSKSNRIRIRLFDYQENQEMNERQDIIICSITRNGQHPCYTGCFEIYKQEEGLILINETSLENYVKGVLPGEMPSSYPSEALKAQAICARTYACMKEENLCYPQYQAEVDDSTSCQVYGYQIGTARTDLAVDETKGMILLRPNEGLERCYYYSTSCGVSVTEKVWHGGEDEETICIRKSDDQIQEMNQNFDDYISQKHESHLEKDEPFYRWSYTVEKYDKSMLIKRIKERYNVNGKLIQTTNDMKLDKTGKIKTMRIAERINSSIADCLEIVCEKGSIYIWGEYNIRYVLAQGGDAKLQDGRDYEIQNILPSAFISLQSVCNNKGNMLGYSIIGGGFGHGVGMSQNGAKYMAQAGNIYEEILKTYYSGCVLENLDDL